jgi:hypothetical protein
MEQDKGTRVIACLRCGLEVSVTTDNSGLKLSYDIAQWSKRCCCPDRSGPADCSSFLTLEGIVNGLPRSPKDGT